MPSSTENAKIFILTEIFQFKQTSTPNCVSKILTPPDEECLSSAIREILTKSIDSFLIDVFHCISVLTAKSLYHCRFLFVSDFQSLQDPMALNFAF